MTPPMKAVIEIKSQQDVIEFWESSKDVTESLKAALKEMGMKPKKIREVVKAFDGGIREIKGESAVEVIRYQSENKELGHWRAFEEGTRQSLALPPEWNAMDSVI